MFMRFALWQPVLLIALLVFQIGSGNVRAAGDEYPVIIDQYAPYYYWEDGQPKGVLVEPLTHALREIGVEPKYLQSSWKRSLLEVKEGGVLGLCAAMKLADRKLYGVYPSEPLLDMSIWVATRSTDIRSISSLDDLAGLMIGVVEGYSYGDDFDGMDSLSKHAFLDEELLVKNLLGGRVDAVVGNRRVMETSAARLGSPEGLSFRLLLERRPLFFLFSRRYTNEAEIMARKLSEVLRKMKSDGPYSTVLKQIQ